MKEVIRIMGICEQAFYRWKKKYGGLGTSELRRLKMLEDENRKLKQMVANLSLDKVMLQGVLSKALRPGRRRELVDGHRADYDVSIRRACRIALIFRSLYTYQRRIDDQAELRMRICEIAATRGRYGYRRIHVLLRREGWKINHKRVYRLYKEEGLLLRSKRPKRIVSAMLREKAVSATRPDEVWSMDFMSDALFDGRRLHLMTVVDNYTRESLAIEAGQVITGEHVTDGLTRIAHGRSLPARIKCDNGPEFTSKAGQMGL